MKDKYEVLIVNSQNWQGLSRLPATLAEGACRVHVLGVPGGAISRSRYVASNIFTSPELPKLIEELREHLDANEENYDWVIFGDEPALFAALERRNETWLRCWLPVDPDTEAVDIIRSKSAFEEACQAAGIPIPKTRSCKDLNDIQSAAGEIGYPIMLKDIQGTSGLGIYKVDKADDLESAYQSWEYGNKVLVQEFVNGSVGACEMLLNRGKPVSWFASFLGEPWPGNYGPSTVREVAWLPQLETIISQVGQLTHYHGLCGIDWILDQRDGSLKVLEFNARPTTCYHLARFANVDFAGGIRTMLAGEQSVHRPKLQHTDKLRVYLFPQHVLRCFESGRWRDLVYWIPFVARHDIPWHEPKLLIRQLGRIVLTGLRCAYRSVRR